MNKEEFLKTLEDLLTGISEEEKADALAYYRSYFEDAGEQNEASILKELESPQKVAESIRKNLGSTEGAAADSQKNRTEETASFSYGYTNSTYSAPPEHKEKEGKGWKILAIVLLVLTSPVWLSVLLALAGALLGVIGGVIGILVGVAGAVLGTVVAAVVGGGVVVGSGVVSMLAAHVPLGIGLIGVGLLILAVGVLVIILAVWLLGVWIPWAVKKIAGGCKKLWNRRKGGRNV